MPDLLPGLDALAPDATRKRRADFCVGRVAAQRALAEIGIEGWTVDRREDGRPLWPAAVVGSITHSEGVAIAIVRMGAGCGIGVDLELGRLSLSLPAERLVITQVERHWIAHSMDAPWPLIVFSAKEAAYKALPTTFVSDLGYHDVEFRPDGVGCLAGLLKGTSHGGELRARYTWRPGLVLTFAEFVPA